MPKKTASVTLPELPPLKRFLKYEDLHERFAAIREHIFVCVSREELLGLDGAVEKRYDKDKELRLAAAEVLLAAILWIEAGRTASEILSHAVPEIRRSLGVAVHSLLRWLELKEHTQPTAWLNRSSLADAWIHLFVEYHAALSNPAFAWIWELQELPYVSETRNPYEFPWESWKEK